MSGDCRWSTIAAACAANVPSVGSRFSTLYVATASSERDCLRVVSRSRPPAFTVPRVRAVSV